MRKVLRRRPPGAMVVALVALIVAASGTAVAASKLVNGDKLIKKHSLSGNRLRNKTITGTQVNLNKLGKVPNARNADRATTASNATSLGGQPASSYLTSGALNRTGLVVLRPGQSNPNLFVNGPLSVSVSCSSPSAGETKIVLNGGSSVGNWLSSGNLNVSPGSVPLANSPVDDSSSPGVEKGNTTRVDLLGPGSQALHGQGTFGVNWPAAGDCFFDGYSVS